MRLASRLSRLISPIGAIVSLLVILAGTSCGGTLKLTAPVATPSGVRFSLVRPDARTVALAGTFNQWSVSADRLVQEKRGGPWTIVVPLDRGEYLFMYVVDGEWISPPLAEDYVDDGFGAKNGVVIVRP